ncbi:hypothetical protein BCD67_04885 [Oscillatoriales cyanobacterium USR001]|nr:hypothetical protein BCD67_04885 [Oscillatoriales cyanobacterium USR001]
MSSRVPELIWEHKGEKVQQTPITIAEPDTKSHLIILPQHASKKDISDLKNEAYKSEIYKDFDLAKQLWIRVLAASRDSASRDSIDRDAIHAIERIAIAQHQLTSKDSDETEKSYQPAHFNPISILPNVPLKSSRGIDYTKLRDLLATGKWKEADQETARVMLKVAGREKEKWLDSSSIDNFPCEDLRTIDQLWVKYSNGLFGFSVQKRIYESLGGTREYDGKIWEAFGDRVGWRVNNNWLRYDDLKFNNKIKVKGHLPRGRVILIRRLRLIRMVLGGYSVLGSPLLSRRDL